MTRSCSITIQGVIFVGLNVTQQAITGYFHTFLFAIVSRSQQIFSFNLPFCIERDSTITVEFIFNVGGFQVLLEWLSDRDAADTLRERCREYVAARYDWESAVDSVEALLWELAGGGDAR